MGRLIRYALVVMLLLGASGQVQADDTLTPERIDRWLASMVELRHWAGQVEAVSQESLNPVHYDDALDYYHHLIRLYRHHEAVRDTHRRYGFEHGREWADTGNLVVRVYRAINRRSQAIGTEDGMRETLAEIRRDPELTPSQREGLLRQMESVWYTMRHYGLGVASADRLAVEASQARIEEFMQH